MTKILLVHSFEVEDDKPKFNAISYHRMNKPHQVLSRLFPEFEVVHTPRAVELSDEFLLNFELVLFLRYIDLLNNIDPIVSQLKRLGIKFGVDTDDYWVLSKNHLAAKAYEENKLTEAIIKSLKVCDFVICTTPILQDKIKELNKNVYIIENGIDTEDSSWQIRKNPNDRIRFGFLQGSTHIHDLYLISHDVVKSLKSPLFKEKGQIALAFYYKHGEPSITVGYERILTDSLSVLDARYRNNLILGNTDNSSQPYKRLPFRPVHEFGEMYNDIDISVSPLEDNEFNACKSELKMIEAGFMGCAAMVSNVNPYSLICNKDNSFMFSERDFFYWSRYILNNPNCVEDKKAALKETVAKYDLRLLAVKRKELYNLICG
jgi:glycosyltransferase involved in cell wall biosynthesis